MAIDKETGLTDKQVRFCQEYIIDLNGTQAAVRAGYSEETAKEIGYENLTKPHVSKYLDTLKADRVKRLQIDSDKVLSEISRLAFSDIRQTFADGRLKRIEDLDDDTAAAVQSVKVTTRRAPDSTKEEPEYEDVVEIKLADKKSSLEMLGKHLGELTERIDHSGEININVSLEEAIREGQRRVEEAAKAIPAEYTEVEESQEIH